jgi:hypothetical protein
MQSDKLNDNVIVAPISTIHQDSIPCVATLYLHGIESALEDEHLFYHMSEILMFSS